MTGLSDAASSEILHIWWVGLGLQPSITAFLGNLFQSSTNFIVKNSFLVSNMNLLSAGFKPLFLLEQVLIKSLSNLLSSPPLST